MFKLITLMTFQSLFLVLAQVFLKWGLATVQKFKFSFSWFASLLGNYWLWLTGLSMIISGIIWIYVIKQYPFNQAYPLVSISYIFSLLAAVFLLNEAVPFQRWIGVVIIIIGIFFITYNK